MNIFGKIRAIFTRGTLQDPDADDVFAFAGSKSNSGVSVNQQTVLTYSAIWRGLTLISNAVAGLPIDVYKNTEGGKEKDKRHPAYKLLRRQPNKEMNIVAFLVSMIVRAILRGNSYAYIFRLGSGDPDEIIPLDPDVTYPIKENGVLVYVTRVGDRLHRLEPSDVIHLKGLSENGLVGLSLVQHAKNALGLSLAMEEHASKFFSNNAVPKVVIEHPGHFSNPETRRQFRDEWERAHKGLDNAHKTAVLENGVKVSPFSVNNKDSQFLEGRGFQIKDAANWLNLPPHKLGDSSRTSYSSLEQENQAYHDDSINGWLIRLESEFYAKLLTVEQQENETHTIEFNRNAMVRADIGARFAAYAIAIQNGIMNPNEVRGRENMNHREGGDDFFTPMNMATTSDDDGATEDTGSTAGTEDDTDSDEGDGDAVQANSAANAALARLLDLSVSRLLSRIGLQAKKQAKKPETVRAWIESVDVADSLLATTISAQAEAVGREADLDSANQAIETEIRTWLRQSVGTSAAEFKQLEANTKQRILETLNGK